MTAALQVQQLFKQFPTANGSLEILRGVNLSLERGQALAVTGPSGSGKSTLLYIIGVLDAPTSGNVTLLDQQPWKLAAEAQAAFRNRHIGFVFQDHHLLPQCTVLENVLIPTLAGTGTNAAIEARAKQLLDRVGLSDRLDHQPTQLSGGERQRVAVCRALINQPTFLLADEPTGNLDRATADAVGSLLLELNQEHNTILVCVTHSQELVERFPQRCELRDGLLVDL
ncbi:ATP-binding cassette domain-containing protein [bacterium]|nr:ATP-binding cassette domain-containing protein [bacterium]